MSEQAMAGEGAASRRPFDLTGRVALVTGGGQGLGRGMAAALASAGAHVVVVARRPEPLERAAVELRSAGASATALPWDAADAERAEDLITVAEEAVGARVDTLVHAAGIQIRKAADELTLEEFDAVHGIHVRSAFALSTAVGRRLRSGRAPGSIVLIGSLTSRIGVPGTTAYGTAKSGILGLARTLAVEWASDGVRCNVILPGYFHTELTDDLLQQPDRRGWVESRIPAGRLGQPEDIGGLAVFLAAPASAYITGQAIAVDGGWLAA